MSSHGWRELYRVIRREAQRLPKPRRAFAYSDALIGALLFWAVWHDRPQCWAVARSSFNGLFRPRRLPSYSEFNRRVRSERLAHLLERVFAAFAPPPSVGFCFLDARPLPVGACSTDEAARAGRVYAGFARGYRLHALVDENGLVFAWKLTAMNVAESRVALELLPHAPAGRTVLADSNYDRGPLYDQAAQHGVTLLARPRRGAGRGHRQPNPLRLAAHAIWNGAPREYALRRNAVERAFGWQSVFGGGLSPLPAWVRTPPRVTRWVLCKLTINHVRRKDKQHVA